MHNALAAQFHSLSELTVPTLLEYDNNIVSHTLAINAKRVAKAQPPIVWKHFQYLTLLLTEIYLDRYFTDPVALRGALNDQIERHNLARSDGGSVTAFDIVVSLPIMAVLGRPHACCPRPTAGKAP